MGLLDYLGLNDLADGIREFTNEIDGLKNEIVESVVGPGEELKETVNDIAGSIKGEVTGTEQASEMSPEALEQQDTREPAA